MEFLNQLAMVDWVWLVGFQVALHPRFSHPPNLWQVVQALLSHSDGVNGFWTAFLTNPDLTAAARPPFDPSIVSTVSRSVSQHCLPPLSPTTFSRCSPGHPTGVPRS